MLYRRGFLSVWIGIYYEGIILVFGRVGAARGGILNDDERGGLLFGRARGGGDDDHFIFGDALE